MNETTENKTDKPAPQRKPATSNINLRVSALNTKSAKKEWTPAPGFAGVTSPIHEHILTITGSNKWFQISQLCLIALSVVIFLLEGAFKRQVNFAYTYTIALSIFYLLQVVYCCFYKKAISGVDAHYASYTVLDHLPVSEIANRLKVEKLLEKTTKCFTSSIFGLALSLLLVVSALIMDEVSSLSELESHPLIIIWGFFIPATIVWCAIHYGIEGVGILILIAIGGVIDNACEFLISPFILILVAACLIYSGRCSLSALLRFFAVYMSAVFIFVLQIGTLFSSHKINITFAVISVIACLVPAILTYILKAVGTAIDKNKQQAADEPELYPEPTSEKAMNFLYSYVWGGLCAVLYVVSIILNLCSDKYNWMEYSMKKMSPSPSLMTRESDDYELFSSRSSYSSPYDNDYGSYGSGSRYNSNYGSYGSGSRYNSDYGSYGSGSRYNSNYGNSYDSGSNYRYNSYDY